MTSSVLSTMRALGYQPSRGVCYGLAAMAAQAVIRLNGATYAARIQAITDGDTTGLSAFFDGVTIYSGTVLTFSQYRVLGLTIRQNISSPAQLLSFPQDENTPNDKLSPCVAESLMAAFTRASLKDCLTEMHSHNVPFSLIVNYPEHTVQIGFDGTNWLSVNHDITVYEDDIENRHLLSNVTDELYSYSTDSDERWFASIDLVLREGCTDSNLSMCLRQLHISSNNFSQLSDEQKKRCLYLAQANSQREAVTAFMTVLAELLRKKVLSTVAFQELAAAKRSDGVPGLHLAQQYGHHEVVTASMTELAGLLREEVLPAVAFKKLAAAKSSDGVPGLYRAQQNGHHEAMTAFMRELAGLRLDGLVSEEEFNELAAAKSSGGVPGLQMAQQEGQHEVVTAFMTELAGLLKKKLLSEAAFQELAAAKRSDGVPGLYLAQQYGHHEVVTAFMIVLAELRMAGLVSEAEFKELAAAKRSDGVPGLSLAQENGHHEAVKAFITVLEELRMDGLLSEAAFEELVTTKKDRNGVPELDLVSDTRKNDHESNPRSCVII